ncbi:putative phage portal protein [Escherichia coli]|uniref:Putative phage portal protein n=1 Tax=Escherichia coli TaxID=562 RepID=A0A377EQH6_ECOLX|nr:putative phage portal protein [Escherichia coli]
MTGERLFSVVVRQSSGQRTEKTFSLPVMLYRGVFRAGETYHPGDTVTWGGSLWHCNSMTEDKPEKLIHQPGPWLQNVGGMQEAENDGITDTGRDQGTSACRP